MATTYLELEKIRLDGGTQMRAGINQDTVEDYAEHLTDLPLSIVYFDGKDYWLANGFHRYHAHVMKKAKKMPVEVRKGAQRDAWKASLSANADNGLRRTNADKRKAVGSALEDSEIGKLANREIAKLCAVDEGLIRKVKAERDDKGADSPQRAPVSDIKNAVSDVEIIPDAPSRSPLKPSSNTPAAATTARTKTVELPTANDEQPKDQVGNILTEEKLIKAFSRRTTIQVLMRAVSTIKSDVLDGIERKDPLYVFLDEATFRAEIGNVYRELKSCLPHAVCSYCGGRNDRCKQCRGGGWLNEVNHENYVPEDLKV